MQFRWRLDVCSVTIRRINWQSTEMSLVGKLHEQEINYRWVFINSHYTTTGCITAKLIVVTRHIVITSISRMYTMRDLGLWGFVYQCLINKGDNNNIMKPHRCRIDFGIIYIFMNEQASSTIPIYLTSGGLCHSREGERDNDRVMMICSIFWSGTSSALSCQYKCVANWLYYYEVDRFPHRFPTTGMHLHSPRDSYGHGQSFLCLDHFPTCCRQLVLSSFSLSFATHHNLDLLTGILYYGMFWRFFGALCLLGYRINYLPIKV